MNNSKIGRTTLKSVCLGLAIMASTSAHAATNDDATGAAFFGVEEKVEGLMFTRSDWIQLREEGVLIKEPFLRTELQAVAEEHGWASRRMLRALDRYTKEGTAIAVYRYDGGEGVTLVQNAKGIDIAANCFRTAGWSLAGDSNGKMLYNHIVCNENWQTIFAKTATTALGSALAGSAVAAVSNATAPRNEGDNWYIQGGRGGEATAVSQQQMQNQSSTATTVSIQGLANCGGGHGCD
jgi:hypothetical protein